MPKRTDYTGKKFNHLTALRYSKSGGRGVGAYWLCKCDCGNQVEILVKYLTSGRNKTCGECQYTRDLMRRKKVAKHKEGYELRTRYSRAVRAATLKGIPWDLSIDTFKSLCSSSCFCCGSAANSVGMVDIRSGYTPENSFPICRKCSGWKQDSNLPEFLEHVIKIANSFQSR